MEAHTDAEVPDVKGWEPHPVQDKYAHRGRGCPAQRPIRQMFAIRSSHGLVQTKPLPNARMAPLNGGMGGTPVEAPEAKSATKSCRLIQSLEAPGPGRRSHRRLYVVLATNGLDPNRRTGPRKAVRS